MKIVVTGALGHIGSRLIRELPSQIAGLEIVLVDNLATMRYPALFNLPSGHYSFVEADILQVDLISLFRGAVAVIHLAAITDAASSFANREAVERTNQAGTERVARACAQTGTSLLFTSSTSVYGTAAAVVDENCRPDALKPQSPYAASKLHSEELLRQLGHEGKLRFITCRFGTIFGVAPGMRFHTAVNKFVWQACLGQPVTVWRTALHQKRPYLDLHDAVSAIAFILRGDHFSNDIYNVLTLNATVNDILDEIKKHVPMLNIEFVDTAIMNQLSYEVSRQKFEQLGFQFTGSLRDSVKESVQWLRNCRTFAP